MFAFCNTCGVQPSGSGYLVQKPQQPPKFYSKFADIKENDLKDSSVAVLKVNKSQYALSEGKVNGNNTKFIDKDFPPDSPSVGNIDDLPSDKWRRVSDLIPNAVIFPAQLTPRKAVNTNYPKNIVYQAALAALSQHPQRLKSMFVNQGFNANGAYNFYLKKKGQLQEVVVDDYLPIGIDGLLLFSQTAQASIWNLILQKARAKLHGSYENMLKVTKTPNQVWQELTYAPGDNLLHRNIKQQDLWRQLKQSVVKENPICGLTSSSQGIKWQSIGLTPNHYYTIVDVATLVHKLGSNFQIIKLRNAFQQQQYKGQCSLVDNLFWDQLAQTEQKQRLLSGHKEGLIYMALSDYYNYFTETYTNSLQNVKNYFDQPIQFLNQQGALFDIQILKQNYYAFTIDQDNMRQPIGMEYQQQGWSRSSMVLVRNNSQKNVQQYEYVDGILKYNQEQTTIRVNLTPGKYLLHIKLDPTIQRRNYPQTATLIAFSPESLVLKSTNWETHRDIFRSVFLKHARNNKRQLYNNDLMWSAWRLIPKGGFAYIGFGNHTDCPSKFVIKFSQEVFDKANYVLEEPFRGKGEQTMNILPGQQQIILMRIKNTNTKEVTFPPPISLQIVAKDQ